MNAAVPQRGRYNVVPWFYLNFSTSPRHALPIFTYLSYDTSVSRACFISSTLRVLLVLNTAVRRLATVPVYYGGGVAGPGASHHRYAQPNTRRRGAGHIQSTSFRGMRNVDGAVLSRAQSTNARTVEGASLLKAKSTGFVYDRNVFGSSDEDNEEEEGGEGRGGPGPGVGQAQHREVRLVVC